MAHEPVTYGQLDQLLLDLGFIRQSVPPAWGRYEHAGSGTVIILAAKRPTEPARPSEVASARIHLVAKGLISEGELEQKLGNRFTQASSAAEGKPA